MSSSCADYKRRLVDFFIFGNIDPLAEALARNDQIKKTQELKKQFRFSSTQDIISALDGSNNSVHCIARKELNHHFTKLKESKEKFKAGFTQIGFGKHEEEVDIKGQCLWVPASIRHDVRKTESGLTRYSFFVYGGINIQPHVNVSNGGNEPLGGEPVNSQRFDRDRIKHGFQDHHIISPTNEATKDHELLQRAGFTDLDSRVNRIFLPSKEPQFGVSINRNVQYF